MTDVSTADTPYAVRDTALYDPATTEVGRRGDLEWPEARALAEEYAPRVRKIIARIPEQVGWNLWVGPGWFPLICELDDTLAAIHPAYEVYQVKEKFGGLRYYVGAPEGRPFLHESAAAIEAAYVRSWSICEVCSEPGILRSDGGSLRVTCATHAPAGSVPADRPR